MAGLTSGERILKAIDGEKVDRLPVFDMYPFVNCLPEKLVISGFPGELNQRKEDDK